MMNPESTNIQVLKSTRQIEKLLVYDGCECPILQRKSFFEELIAMAAPEELWSKRCESIRYAQHHVLTARNGTVGIVAQSELREGLVILH